MLSTVQHEEQRLLSPAAANFPASHARTKFLSSLSSFEKAWRIPCTFDVRGKETQIDKLQVQSKMNVIEFEINSRVGDLSVVSKARCFSMTFQMSSLVQRKTQH